MIKTGKLSNGFKFEVDSGVFDDCELLDALAGCEADPLSLSAVSLKVLGKDQRQRLYDHLRDKETGRVPVKATYEAIGEIMEIAAQEDEEGKNC